MTPIENFTSIVIPIHETKALNLKFQDYVKELTRRGSEVILVVDQSHNGVINLETTAAIERISKHRDDRLKIYRGEFGSPGMARNYGKDFASGKWIYFWDADDCPRVDEALAFVSSLERNSAQIGIASAKLIFSNGKVLSIGSHLKDFVSWPGIWRMAFQRTLIEDINFEAWDWCEDQDFMIKAMNKSELILTSKEAVYEYFVNVPKSSTTTTSNWTSIPKFIASLESRLHGGSGSQLDFLFLVKNLYSLRRYVSFMEWAQRMSRSLSLAFSLFSLSKPKIRQLRELESNL